MSIITVTERTAFKRCRRAWNWSSLQREGLEPLLPHVALFTGSIIHKTLEAWQHNPTESLGRLYLEVAVEQKAKMLKRYEQLTKTKPSDEELKPINDAMLLGASMCVNYQKKWDTPVPKGWTLVQAEQKCIIPIPGTLHVHVAGHLGDNLLPFSSHCIGTYGCPTHREEGWPFGWHYLEGKLDLVLLNPKGRLFVVDYKTYEKHPSDKEIRSNDQFLGYLWIAHRMFLDVPIGGFIYDGLWKRSEPPVDKRTGKVLKKAYGQEYTFDDLFYREIFLRTPEELAEFEQELVWEAFEMANNPPIYKNRRYDCVSTCGFEAVCYAKSNGDDWEDMLATKYTKREDDSEPA